MAVDVEYYTLHSRIRRLRGPASQYQCVDCKADAIDWSHVHGLDKNDPDSYDPRCHHCHAKYDDIGLNFGTTKIDREDIPEVMQLLEEGWKQKEVAELFGVQQACISKIKHKVRKWR